MTRNLSEDSSAKRAATLEFGERQLFRRPAPVSQGLAIFEIKVFEDTVVVTAGDGAFKFDIPSDLDESELIDVEAWVTEPSSSGNVVVTIWNETQGIEMLSTALTIDAGELNDKDAAVPFVINIANAEVAYGDEIWINVDNAGTGALGLGVKVAFTPSENASIAFTGAQGAAGGITDFEGPWTNTTVYQAGDIVTHNNVTYVSIQNHTSNTTNDEPGVGTNEADFWAALGTIPMEAGVTFQFISTYPLLDGIRAPTVVPSDCTITEGWILADAAGNATVDIWMSDFAGYPPNVGDSITGAAPLTLTGSIKNLDIALTGWTTALSEGDILVPYVSGVTIITRLAVFLKLEKG